MAKCLVMGATGMLGHAVVQELLSKGHEVLATAREQEKAVRGVKYLPFDAVEPMRNKWELISSLTLHEQDYVINCIGIIKPHMEKSPAKARYINSVFPHVLADACDFSSGHPKLIHITTDCVYKGDLDPNLSYLENHEHDATDDYGRSKSLGEPKNAMVIRTSIIGPELHSFVSLVEWVRKQGGKTINGFTNHFWNGMTTKMFGNVCHQIMDCHLWEKRTVSIYSYPVNKFELVSMIAQKYGVVCDICPVEANTPCNRKMSSLTPFPVWVPTIQKQIQEM